MFYVYMYISKCMYLHDKHANTCGSQKKTPNLLELDLQAVVSNPLWMPGTAPRSNAGVGLSYNL